MRLGQVSLVRQGRRTQRKSSEGDKPQGNPSQRRKPLKNHKAVKNLGSLLTATLVFSLTGMVSLAQTAPVAAPAVAPSTPAPKPPMIVAPTMAGPVAGPVAAPVDPFPKSDPKFFTAKTPTLETVNSFLNHLWGFDSSPAWRVMGIMPTKAAGVSEVIVFLVDTNKPDAKLQRAVFYVLPDGKYAIGQGAGVVPFGADPFAATHDLLKARANGPARGSASKDLLLVEFADLQCPFCAKAQDTMDQIVKDFPGARVVFQQLPLVEIHPSAFKAAAYGVCAQKQSDEAFYKYAAGVFDTQGGLTPTTDDTILKADAKRAGLYADAIAACADTQATKDVVNADIKLGDEAGIVQTPTLSINGRVVSLGIDYETLKKMIVFQAQLDGVATGAAADILTPKPVLSTLPK